MQGNLEDASRFLAANPDIEYVELLIADNNAVMRGKRVERFALNKIYQQGLNLPGSLFAMDMQGETVEATGLGQSEGDADRLCWPVKDTLRPVPWLPQPAGQLLMTMRELDGRRFFAEPRNVLDRVREQLSAYGLRAVVAVELEFYLTDVIKKSAGNLLPPRSPIFGERASSSQVYGMAELDEYDNFLQACAGAARQQGIAASTAVSEYAPGQYEINLDHDDDVMRACDQAVLLKRLVKGCAAQHGYAATFMAKPCADRAGNGMHIHVSLLDDHGNNVLAGEGSTGSETLKQCIGGLCHTMAESMLIFAPNANSWRRFQRGNYVPLAPDWGYNNRFTALRIPASDRENTRIEHRVAGADANPYLVVAAMLSSMLYGIKERLKAPEPVQQNPQVQAATGLPENWSEALNAFRQSRHLSEFLGEEFCAVFNACKQAEYRQFNQNVTALELDWYFHRI